MNLGKCGPVSISRNFVECIYYRALVRSGWGSASVGIFLIDIKVSPPAHAYPEQTTPGVARGITHTSAHRGGQGAPDCDAAQLRDSHT